MSDLGRGTVPCFDWEEQEEISSADEEGGKRREGRTVAFLEGPSDEDLSRFSIYLAECQCERKYVSVERVEGEEIDELVARSRRGWDHPIFRLELLDNMLFDLKEINIKVARKRTTRYPHYFRLTLYGYSICLTIRYNRFLLTPRMKFDLIPQVIHR